MSQSLYSREFYQRQKSSSRASAEEVLPLVLQLVPAKSVIDVGCGVGTWLAVFQEQGCRDILGIDGDYVDRRLLQIPVDRFVARDLTEPLRVDRVFDLVVSLEVAEHLPAGSAVTFVQSLVALGPVVLFSAAIPMQGGVNHINEQWPDYWASIFGRWNYVPVDSIRPRIWNNEKVSPFYIQNLLLFVREDMLDAFPLLRTDRENTRVSQLSLVHPKQYLRRTDPYNIPLTRLLSVLPYAVKHYVMSRLRSRGD